MAIPAPDRVAVRESLFAEAFNGLLQQNRHKPDILRRSDDVCCWGWNGHAVQEGRLLTLMLWTAPTLRHRSAIGWLR
jgi:hypothetical protein